MKIEKTIWLIIAIVLVISGLTYIITSTSIIQDLTCKLTNCVKIIDPVWPGDIPERPNIPEIWNKPDENRPASCEILTWNDAAYQQCILTTEDESPLDGSEQNPEPVISGHWDTWNTVWTLEYLGTAPASELQLTDVEPNTQVASLHTKNGFPSIHLYLPLDLRSSYADFQTGELFIFSGTVKYLDAGAGNRWYEGISVDEIVRVRSQPAFDSWNSNPTKEEIESRLETMNYCETQDDCATFYASCPFGCGKAVNKAELNDAQQLIENYRSQQAKLGNPQCEYKCVEIKGVKCEANKCIVLIE